METEKKNYYKTDEEKLEKVIASIEKEEQLHKEKMAKLKAKKATLMKKIKLKQTDKKKLKEIALLIQEADESGSNDQELLEKLKEIYHK